MVLIAATGIALLPLRLFLAGFPGISAGSTPAQILRLGLIVDAMLCPVAWSLSLALWVLRLRQPRPGLPRVFRQPGMAASTAILVYSSFFMTATLISLFLNYFSSGIFTQHMFIPMNFVMWILILAMSFMGITVFAVWTVLWLIGAWRPEPSWIDRAGRVLGIYWVTNSLLFGSAVLAGFF